MIRFSEHHCSDIMARCMLEGDLRQDDVAVVAAALEEYRQRGVMSVQVVVDRLTVSDPAVCRGLPSLLGDNPRVELVTSSPFMRALLQGYGMEVGMCGPGDEADPRP